MTFLERSIPNFRDLGNLPTDDGRRLATARLLRSSAVVQKSPEVREALGARLPAAVYFDLRTQLEIDRDGEPDTPSGWLLVNRPLHDADLGHPIKFSNFPEALRRYTEIAREIAIQAIRYPVLVACSLGKDRTGFAIALLLQWLGVTRRQILQDYAASNAELSGARRRLPKRWHHWTVPLTTADPRRCARFLDFAAENGTMPLRKVSTLSRRILLPSSKAFGGERL